jgi:hypothetical protein
MPGSEAIGIAESERPLRLFGLDRDRSHHVRHFSGRDAALENDGTDVLFMEFFCESAQHRMLRIRSNALDDELPARYANRHTGPVRQQCMQTLDYTFRRLFLRRMAGWVHQRAMQSDRKLNEKLGEFRGESRSLRCAWTLAQ